MNHKLISFGPEARKKLASGANQLSEAVVSTLGPRSKNVAINQEYPAPKVIHDGVSVAREIRLKDPFEDMGATLLREAASKTNDLAGDGTTTATLLANTLLQEGIKLVDGGIVEGVFTGKVNAMELRERLIEASTIIDQKLTSMAIKLSKPEESLQIATISSGMKEIGLLVTEAIEKVGKDGVIMVEEEGASDSWVEIQEGMEFDNGYLSPYFVTNPDRMVAEYEDVYILITDQIIADGMSLVPLIEKVTKEGKPLLIIAGDVIGPAMQALILTKLKARLPVVAVVAPEYAERRKEMLEDIAVLTGGTVLAAELNKKIADVQLKDLGRAKRIKVTAGSTAIIPLFPDKEEIEERITAIKKQIETEENSFKKTRLEMRLGKLSQGVAIIRVGGASISEIKEKKERVIDAVYATKAALSEGIIAGGGVTLRDIALDWEVTDAIHELVFKALIAPYSRILTNSGMEAPILEKNTVKTNIFGQGIDVTGDKTKMVDMIKSGVIDPVKVTRLAIKHSFSVAAIMLTTDTLITDDPEDQKQHAQNHFQ